MSSPSKLTSVISVQPLYTSSLLGLQLKGLVAHGLIYVSDRKYDQSSRVSTAINAVLFQLYTFYLFSTVFECQ